MTDSIGQAASIKRMVCMLFSTRYREPVALSTYWQYGFLVLLVLILSQPALAASDRTPLVVVSEAQTQSIIKQVPLTGTITSARVARLSAEVSGQVEKVRVEVGDRVKTGDELLQLDSEIEALTLRSSQAETERTRAELADSRRRYADAERLLKQNNISANEFRLLQAEVEIDAAALQRQLAEERRYKARLERHTLKAPFDGVISERSTEMGEWIEPGKPVLTLVSIDELRIEFRVPQDFYMRINDQSDITVTLDALPEREFQGIIDAVVPVSDPSARTFLIHVLLDKGDIRMTPGMSAHGLLRLNTDRQGVVISRDALLRYPDGRVTVWVIKNVNSTPTVTEKPVSLGHSFNGLVSIEEGLQAGDVVVVQGNESLQEGQQVRIQAREQAGP
jgi:RND family efflux transporter MFP subunit